MQWLNYHHLLYFWTTAREGSLSAASEVLHLAQPTLSSQIKKLEQSLGVSLFSRQGRGLVLTEEGRTVYRYANEIFSLGREMTEAIHRRDQEGNLTFRVGVPDVLSKLVVYRLLRPVLQADDRLRLVTLEGKFDSLLGELALHKLDVVLSETPVPPSSTIRAFNHTLGECSVAIFGTTKLADQMAGRFPDALANTPMLLPTHNTVMRRALEQWFDESGIRPVVRHEFEDSALLKVFGQAGEGVFPASVVIADEICRQYDVRQIGILPQVRDRYYAISAERRIKHPAVMTLCDVARSTLFSQDEIAKT